MATYKRPSENCDDSRKEFNPYLGQGKAEDVVELAVEIPVAKASKKDKTEAAPKAEETVEELVIEDAFVADAE